MRWLFLVPFFLFVVIAGVFAVGLSKEDRNVIPSPLIGQTAPKFALDPIEGYRPGDAGFAQADLMKGEASVVNFWASWCTPCRQEHPLLMALSQDEKVAVHGIDYRDKAPDARRFLESLGDPFTQLGADKDGRTAIDWGVYGVPETYVVGPDGTILVKHVGPLTVSVVNEKILPALRPKK